MDQQENLRPLTERQIIMATCLSTLIFMAIVTVGIKLYQWEEKKEWQRHKEAVKRYEYWERYASPM